MLKKYLEWVLKYNIDFVGKEVQVITTESEWLEAIYKQYDENGVRNVEQDEVNGFKGAGLYDFVTDGTYLCFNKIDRIMQSGLDENKKEERVDPEDLERELLKIAYTL
ncbi:hypothetical protein [Clostridium botulinum]|uniref:hypothetical protein n=1 Tax=Clostridium botulinum TaxID=1491 RepID=UPI001E3053E8|nr:hypothetical protein [Clostridium botulinum]MCD3254357.1 hypothetical protein [Clostridium botulinum C/D]MCD3279857.1 hypothetical protein [Clostridium botulinum C/D]MCD3339588.1 hypothetical protein [Clostridium botulinum C/D]MCD3357496.1 hypothetical protein [Clostridium botulinum C/D]